MNTYFDLQKAAPDCSGAASWCGVPRLDSALQETIGQEFGYISSHAWYVAHLPDEQPGQAVKLA